MRGRPPGGRAWRARLGGAERRHLDPLGALSPPARAGRVDHLDRLGDRVLGAELVDRAPAALEGAVVVEDQVPADAEAGVQAAQRQSRRLVGVGVEADDGPAALGQRGQRLLEEAGHEAHAVLIAQAREAGAHVFEGRREEVELTQVERAVVRGVRLGEALEGVGHPHRPLVAHRVERRAHEDRRSAPPRAGFDQVSFDAVGDHRLHAGLQIVEAAEPDHRQSLQRPVHPGRAQAQAVAAQLARHHGAVRHRADGHRAGPRQVAEAQLEQVEIGDAQGLDVRGGTGRARLPGARQVGLCVHHRRGVVGGGGPHGGRKDRFLRW